MIIEISVAFIAAAFVVLVIFAIIGIVKSGKTLKETNSLLRSTKKDLDELSEEGLSLIKHADDLAVDLKRKLHALDFLIQPLSHTEKEITAKSKKLKNEDLFADILESLAAGVVLFSKIKDGIRDYGKNR